MRQLFLSLIFLIPNYSFSNEVTKEDWSYFIYHGKTAKTIFMKLLRFEKPNHTGTTITSIEANLKKENIWNDYARFEWAYNLTRRHQKGRKKDFFEVNTFLLLRFVKFPWNKYLFTTVAFGEGLSYANSVPFVETNDSTNKGKSNLLNFLSYEISIALPKCRRFSAVYRLHHRSGIFGLFNNVSGGSNVTAFGLRYSPGEKCY